MIGNHHEEATLDINARDLANFEADMAREPYPFLTDEELSEMEAEHLAWEADIEAALAEEEYKSAMRDAWSAVDRALRAAERVLNDSAARARRLSIERAKASN